MIAGHTPLQIKAMSTEAQLRHLLSYCLKDQIYSDRKDCARHYCILFNPFIKSSGAFNTISSPANILMITKRMTSILKELHPTDIADLLTMLMIHPTKERK